MTTRTLTQQQIHTLVNFKGYGNLSGPFWFIGMEEGGKNEWDELVGRADHWGEVEDLSEGPRPWAPRHDLRKLTTSTWMTMCRIVGRLRGQADWAETETVRCYQSQHLGRLGGETFLTEVLPLPKKSTADWPYATLYATKEKYEAAVLPKRTSMLRRMFDDHKPAYVFCYGKGFWAQHKKIFEGATFEPILEGEAEMATFDGSTITLTRFFDPSFAGVNVEFIDRLCEVVTRSSDRQRG